MPLRRKHVRRVVFVLLVLGVVGPAAWLTFYGLSLRGGAYGRALEAFLEARLRCDATVRRARPTGPSTAVADAVTLAWTAGDGRLTLRLEEITAEVNRFGWYVRAARGELSLTGPKPAEALAALNQRLVQMESPSELMSLAVERLRVSLDLAPLAVETELRALALSNMAQLAVSFYAPEADSAAVDDTGPRPIALARLCPTSGHGVFGGFHVALPAVPLSRVRQALRVAGLDPSADVAGTADLSIDWHWPETDAAKAIVCATARQVRLADWTPAAPGGPVVGTADLTVRYERPRSGPGAIELRIETPGGTIRGQTLTWLGALAGLRGPVPAPETVPFEPVAIDFRAVGGRGWFTGEQNRWGTVPLLTVRLLNLDLPVLAGWARPFDADGLWQGLSPALLAPAPAKATDSSGIPSETP